MSVHETLRRARETAGWTQKALAQRLTIGCAYMSDIERGYRNFPRARVAMLPEPIRTKVRDAIIAELRKEIAELESI